MNWVDAFIARLKTEVPDLHDRVEGVAELAALMASGQLPKQTPAAWVLFVAEDGGTAIDLTGGHRQEVATTIGVVLVHRVAGDGKGSKALAEIDPLRIEVRETCAGWEPEEATQAIEYRRGRLLGLNAGHVFQQLDFTARWQLRR